MEKIRKVFLTCLFISFITLPILIYEIYSLNNKIDYKMSFCKTKVVSDLKAILDVKVKNLKIEDNDIKYDVEYGANTIVILKYLSGRGYNFDLKMKDNSFKNFNEFSKKYIKENSLKESAWQIRDDIRDNIRDKGYKWKK